MEDDDNTSVTLVLPIVLGALLFIVLILLLVTTMKKTAAQPQTYPQEQMAPLQPAQAGDAGQQLSGGGARAGGRVPMDTPVPRRDLDGGYAPPTGGGDAP